MILYDLDKTCSDVAMANILAIVKRVMGLIQIIVPILLIIGLIIIFIRMIINPDEKKHFKRLRNSVLALALVFIIPVLVNVVMLLFDDSFSLSRCWNYSESVENPKESTFIKIDDRNNTSVLVDPSEYESGGNSTSNSTSSSDNSSNNDSTSSTNNSSNNGSTSSANNSLISSSNGSSSSNNSSNATLMGTGMGGKARKISIKYNKKDSAGRCGKKSGDKCAEIATVEYPNGTVKYYMRYQNNSGLLGGSCRSHAFTCGMNAVNSSTYNTLDLQNYLYSTGDKGVLKGRSRFNKVINNYGVKAKAYFDDISISKATTLAKKALDSGQPVIIFVSHDKCSDLASSHHALLLLGYDNDGKVVFLDSCSRYPSAKKRTIEQLGKCMSPDSIAKNWMRMVIFSF